MKSPFVIKVCSKCKKILVANEMNFNKDKRGKYKLKANCKICKKKYEEEYLKTENGKRVQKEKTKKYQQSEKGKKSLERYYQNNREEKLEYQRKYTQQNPNIKFNENSKRRQLEEIQGDGISKEQWLEMMEFFDWKCAYSDKYLGGSLNKDRTIDHIVPLSKDGEHEIWNCVPMLKQLNSKKRISNMEDWYMEQEFFNIDKLLKIYEWIEYAYKKWR